MNQNKASQIWNSIQTSLCEKLGESDYSLWISPLTFSYDLKAENIVLLSPDPYFKSWVTENFLEQIREVFDATELKNTEITLAVNAISRGSLEATDSEIQPTIIKLAEDLRVVSKKPYQLSLLPTTLCRTTFFRPVPRSSLRPSNESFDHPPIETQWAILIWHGPDCGIKEEDVLILIIHRWIKAGCKPFSCSYSDLLNDLGYKKSKQGKHYTSSYSSLKEHIDRLSKISFMLKVKKGAGVSSGGRIHVLKYAWDDEVKRLTIFIDPEFGNGIAKGYITGLDNRHLLEKDVSKALHRFISSHEREGHFPLLNVAQAINMDLTNPITTIRRMMSKALTELKKIGFLTKKSGIKNDNVHWYRENLSLSGPKLLAEIKK